MIDTMAIIAKIDLRRLIERDSGSDITTGKRTYCPFCQRVKRSTPALQVYDNRYYCFGCGAGGDAIDYIKRRDNVDFQEACRRLGWNGGQIDEKELMKSQEEYIFRKKEDEKKRIERLDQILSEYSAGEIWAAYHRRMQEDQIQWWMSQGIPKDWQDYLQLGYTTDKPYYDKQMNLCHSSAYTIPYFHKDFAFKNVQYRLVNPINPKDRYRFESGLKAVYYMVTPSQEMKDKAVICEGAKKAIVSRVKGFDESYSVFATPSKTDFGGVQEAVKDCGQVLIIPDPDAWEKPANSGTDWKPAPIKLKALIGKVARIIKLPVKIDDGLLQYGLNLDNYIKNLCF
jgi:hypothetical protein